jgi:ADP-ribosylglycohydrolase
MVEFIISLGGDTDTIAAMAGALFGAANGVRALPQDKLARLEACGELEALGAGLFRACPSG